MGWRITPGPGFLSFSANVQAANLAPTNRWTLQNHWKYRFHEFLPALRSLTFLQVSRLLVSYHSEYGKMCKSLITKKYNTYQILKTNT